MGNWTRTVLVRAAVDLGERARWLRPWGIMVVVVVQNGACRIAAAAAAAAAATAATAAVSACFCCEQK